MSDILVIGDAHARPDIDNRRFTWLGNLIADLKPDLVVDMGDWSDMASLSSYDGSALTGSKRPTKAFEGRRYKADVEAGIDARERIYDVFRRSKKRKPLFVALGGNHDDERISRALNMVPELEGVIGIKDHLRREYGWKHVPFLEPFQYEGFSFSHYMPSGVMGKPIGGEYPATTLLKKQFTSCVVGHSHLFDESHRAKADGGKIQAFVAGCYLAPKQWEHYAGQANQMWDKGILYMKGVEDGFCTGGFNWITVEQIRRVYG